jgi:dTDP-glucose 4,6-dehydratase
MRVLLTGGLGFIGSAVLRLLLEETDFSVLNLDKVTYAATKGSVAGAVERLGRPERYRHSAVDIADAKAVSREFEAFAPDAVIHLAAESHVDRSIDSPDVFITTNIIGTYNLLEAARRSAGKRGREHFRFVHVSTDEVFGALAPGDSPFTEETPYSPHSPYSASKAASDHLVRAWFKTYGLPAIVTNCSNNYGPFQFPEKLIPLMILKARAHQSLPVYGRGENVRDWLFVEDHARGILAALLHGQVGETYAFGGRAERRNIEVVRAICDVLDQLDGSMRHFDLVEFVVDRPGHDLRYAIDPSKAERALGWSPSQGFEEGLERTVRWYVSNEWWWRPLVADRYAGQRLGRAAVEATGE